MPYKDSEKQKLAQRRHYVRNKELYIKKGVNWKHKNFNRSKVYAELPENAPTLLEQIHLGGWYTPSLVSELFHIPRMTVKNACVKGRLRAFKIGRFWVIEPEDAERWIRNKEVKVPVTGAGQRIHQPTDDTKVEKTTNKAYIKVTSVIEFTDEFDYAEQLMNLRDAVQGYSADTSIEVVREH